MPAGAYQKEWGREGPLQVDPLRERVHRPSSWNHSPLHHYRSSSILRADSGFCREELMRWCEDNHVSYVFGLARNERLRKRTGKGCVRGRWNPDARASPRESSPSSAIAGAAVGRGRGAWNPRYLVTSLQADECRPVSCTNNSTVPAVSWKPE